MDRQQKSEDKGWFMTKHNMSLIAIIYLLLIAACSSGGGSDAPPPSSDSDPLEAFELNDDFADGNDGWEFGFADLPVDYDEALYELDGGWRSLPEELDGSGIYLQGHNRSDDLFMYITKQVTSLVPNTTYRLNFEIDIATDIPSGFGGIGGSPTESIFFKAGASAMQPMVFVDETDHQRMNIDKGNQAEEGGEMVNIGNLVNENVVEEGRFAFKSLNLTGFSATTDSDGNLWLIIGTDSGYEGLTTLYITRIMATLMLGNSPDTGSSEPNESSSSLVSITEGNNYLYTGIGSLFADSRCTATYIKVSFEPDAPAYVITNGHCVQNWHPNEVILDEPADYSVIFNYFVDTVDEQVVIPVSRIAYSTMKGRDVAILELDATNSEMASVPAIESFRIADSEVPVSSMRVLGIPVNSIDANQQFLRQENCDVLGGANLLEFQWHFFDTYRNNCQDIFGGSSGSPVFYPNSDEIFALINTTTIGGLSACALGSPCEVTAEGTELRENTSYATPIHGVGNCFDVAGIFDLMAPDCPLDDGAQLSLEGYPQQAQQPLVTDNEGNTKPSAWNTVLMGDFTHYRFKTGPVQDIDCRDEADYSAPIALADADMIDEVIPEAEGVYYLCVLAGNSNNIDEAWQSASNATIVIAKIDTTPPSLEPMLSLNETPEGFSYEPIFQVPELANFSLKHGPVDAIDCDDPADYMPYRRIPLFIEKGSETPAKICVIGSDYAGNLSPPKEWIVGEDDTN